MVLHVFEGVATDVFDDLKQVIPSWQHLFFNFDESGYGRKRDQKIIKYCHEGLHVTPHAFSDFNLHGATDIKKTDGSGYKVFTPYFKQWIQRVKRPPIKTPSLYDLRNKQVPIQLTDRSPELNKLINQGYNHVYEKQIGESSARKVLKDFISNKLVTYEHNRDVPFLNGTSHLSRYLRTGEISIRTVYAAVIQEPDSDGRDTFVKELAWRDYYNMIYAMYSNQKHQAINTNFQNIYWDNNQEKFEAWKKGKTGFPIIDAAMRQLNQTGWMHNRLRMIVASFLTKDLLVDWRWGEVYFQQKLIDYDPASNIGGWQWAASTGTDSVPYFRIFNPKLQSEKFDPNGLFIKKYVTELRHVEGEKIHCPTELSKREQKKYNVIIGKDYPDEIVDHKMARLKAIEVYKNSKEYES